VSLARTRTDRVAAVALWFAAVYATVFVVAGFVLPVYESATVTSSGEPTSGSDTLIGANGPGVLVVLCLPLVATILVWRALRLRSAHGATVAWTLTGLFAVVNGLAMPSIGLFVLPVTAALVLACSTGRRRPEQHDPAPRAAATR
jgi:hypothetical protein